MTQEGGAQHRRRHTSEGGDLAARHAGHDLGLGIEQNRRIESQDSLFIRHANATLMTRHHTAKRDDRAEIAG